MSVRIDTRLRDVIVDLVAVYFAGTRLIDEQRITRERWNERKIEVTTIVRRININTK